LSRGVGLLVLTAFPLLWHKLRGHIWPRSSTMTDKRRPKPGIIKKLTMIGGPITLTAMKPPKKKKLLKA
jgi:hypothetical protein